MYLLSSRWYLICTNEANLNTLSMETSLCIYCFHWPLCLWPRVGRDSRILFRDLTSFPLENQHGSAVLHRKTDTASYQYRCRGNFLCSLPKKYYWWPWSTTGCHKWQFSCERWFWSSTFAIVVKVILQCDYFFTLSY